MISRPNRVAIVMLTLAIVLGGCAIQPPSAPSAGKRIAVADWSVASFPTQWQLTGRTALRIDDEAVSASLHWQTQARQYQIDLRGALGSGSLRLVGDANSATLTTAEGEQFTATNAQELVRATTGYELPVGLLRWWVTGRPAPWLTGHVVVDAQQRAQVIRQGGWEVTYDRYEMRSGYALPGRLSVQREGVEVRLSIRTWQLGS